MANRRSGQLDRITGAIATLARRWRVALAVGTALTACSSFAQDTAQPIGSSGAATLEEQFRDPPNSARPRVWWHWMNGNVSKEGIAKDLAWMKRIGIGGLHNFDANLTTPQIVAKRLVYMTPEWKDAFRFAAGEADRLGLELAIAASPGWSETGGPWVKPPDGMKKLVWSELDVPGGERFVGKLPLPPTASGPFQSLPVQGALGATSGDAAGKPAPTYYADVAVLAVPVGSAAPVPVATYSNAAGEPVDGSALTDTDLRSTVSLAPSAAQPAQVRVSYASRATIRSASLFVPGAASLFSGAAIAPRLEASDDGSAWRHVVDIALTPVPTTVGFPAVSAAHFRLVLNPAPGARPAFTPGVGVDLGPLAAMFSQEAAPGAIKVGDFRLSADDRVDRFETKAGFSIAPDFYALSQAVAEVGGAAPPGRIQVLTGKLRAEGTLDWSPPKGRWRVLRLGYSLVGTTNHPAPPEATGLEVDKFDAAAVRRYLEHYLGLYKDAAGPELVGERGVRALLTDSIEVGAANWTPQLIAQFRRLRGYDATPWLPALTSTIVGSRAQSDRFLFDFRRTLADLIASEHYGTIAKVAHENGLKVYGEALEDRRPSLGDDMAMRRHADVPMAAMWTHPRDKGARPTYLADIKGAASVAHIYGQNLVAAESLTSAFSPWGDSPASLKRIIDLEFALGVNLPVIHTSVHVPVDAKAPGLSLGPAGQFFNRQETWADLAKPWIDYIARNALMLQQGSHVADIAYFYGEEAPLTGLYGEKPVADAPTTVGYDFVNAAALADALTSDGADLVTPGGARYRALYLGGSSRQMTLPTLRRLAQLVDGGATIVGLKPQNDPGLATDAGEYAALLARLWPGAPVARSGSGRVIASADIDGALQAMGVAPDLRFAGGNDDHSILFLHRRIADGDIYFLSNRKDRTETVDAHFRVTGKAPELWHAESGASEPVSYRIGDGETVVPLTLGPDQSVHIVFRKPATAKALTIAKAEPVELVELAGPWAATFQAGRGAPASVRFPSLAAWDENAAPGIKYFSGIATYSKDFALPARWNPRDPLLLDLGEVRELAEVSVNGSPAGTVWHAPYRLDISHLAKPGRNRLEIRVANLWVNRLIGDAQPGQAKITWTAIPTYRADAPLRRSGLIGPVRLLHGASKPRGD